MTLTAHQRRLLRFCLVAEWDRISVIRGRNWSWAGDSCRERGSDTQPPSCDLCATGASGCGYNDDDNLVVLEHDGLVLDYGTGLQPCPRLTAAGFDWLRDDTRERRGAARVSCGAAAAVS